MQKCAAVSPIEGIGSLLFGLWLVIMPGFCRFADVRAGLYPRDGWCTLQIASLSAARRWTPVPGGFYCVVPVAILLAGLVALFNPTGVRSTARRFRYRNHSLVLCGFGIDKLVQIYPSSSKAPVTGGKE